MPLYERTYLFFYLKTMITIQDCLLSNWHLLMTEDVLIKHPKFALVKILCANF